MPNASTTPVTMITDTSGASTIFVIFGITSITTIPSATSGYTSHGTSISCGNCELNTKIASAFTNPTITLRG